ncbi:VOC family protein [Aestuariivirga sp.]|uniref:VOC family protein n=1 Tax=Aestuariivirga sp. TaxID=2650926 RepID=UPI00359388A3
MLGLDHVGLLTPDVDKATAEFARVLNATAATRRFDDEILTVSVRFLRGPDGMVYEMIAPLGGNSVVSAALRKGQSIINQLAYRTASIADDTAALKPQGFMPLGPAKPAIAFGGAPVQFLLSPMGFIVELIEAPDHVHDFHPLDRSTLSVGP